MIHDPAEEFRDVPPVDTIWQRRLGRYVGNPTRVYFPTAERIAQLRAMPYHEYLMTPEWKERRRVTILAQQSRCQRCRATSSLQVHHRSYEHVGDEWPEDLEVLCYICHREEHGIAA